MKDKSILLLIVVIGFVSCNMPATNYYNEWHTYAGSKDGNRYSPNTQITPANVSQLKVAWSYSSGDKDPDNHSQNQCNPIIVDGILYGTSPRLKLFALDAATGQQIWSFDPANDSQHHIEPSALNQISRGVVYWQDEHGQGKRILYSAGSRLYAINAIDGKLIDGFGEYGSIDLKKDLDQEHTEDAYVAGTTPGIIYKDLLIMGMRLTEGEDALSGHIRAFDVHTGKRRWIFHTIPHPGELGYDTWEDKNAWKKTGGANCWAGMALDEKRGIVYIPTGSATPDFYGGFRKGQNLFANSLVALDAETGKYIWHYQVVHHDMWDRDLPANPNLVTVNHDGKQIDAVAQITKHGFVFLLNRTTGRPIFPIDEKAVPQDALPGEKPWPTQPIPVLPEPFARQHFDEQDINDMDTASYNEMLAKFKLVKNRTMFSPPSKAGGWIFPGFDGGGEWGGAAVDPSSHILYVNCSELPWAQVMIDVPKSIGGSHSTNTFGKAIYSKYCMACHGPELKGNGVNIPSLIDIEKKYNETQVNNLIVNGRNMMPPFKQISETERKAIIAFLLKIPEKEPGTITKNTVKSTKDIHEGIPYMMNGYNRFIDKDGYPGIKPPWGTLNAVDLNNGKLLWKVALGEYPELTKRGIAPTGTENYGGPIVTKAGLIFIAATKDEKIRAFDQKTGKLLWQAPLPAAGYATPATYMVNGKQYVVIACGGGKIGSKSGDTYVAFSL
ncbi:pyrrolo-quinoline quinone [Niabella ginsenosidivorans]|uniref:Pyrrolo-quinoline quinone n=1 Tax=Niabella ginsenosidivorans TaxID=1176587 RepID=A0A1A9I548_9BACT|nr:PQQ-binding-like beta-propeller repeat protein [Niabella ginsenosidivorans]ANH81674.1 pyrrolo-quinoline quinone [Niabella ginsenosidivorans]